MESDPLWRYQMETFFTLMDLSGGNPPITGRLPPQKPVAQSFDVILDLRLNKSWANNWDAGDLRRHRAYYDVTVMM